MQIIQSILASLTPALSSNGTLFFIVVMIAAALWGDFGLIFFAAFAVNYDINLWLVFFSAYLGTLIGDSLWYLIGIYLHKTVIKKPAVNEQYKKITYIIDRIFKKKHLLALTAVKFLYGTRVITIFYLVKEKIGYRKFLKYDFISTFFWVIGVGFIGYLIGLGFVWVKTTFKSLQIAATIFIVAIGLLYLMQRKISKRIIKTKIKNKE